LSLAPVSLAKRRARKDNWTDAQWFFHHEIADHAAEWQGGERRVSKELLAQRFALYLKGANSRRDVKDPKGELAAAIRGHVPPGFKYNRAVKENGESTRDYWTLPPLDEFRASFAKAAGIATRDFVEDDG